MKKMIKVIVMIVVMVTGSNLKGQTLIREFVAPDPKGVYTNDNTRKALVPGVTYRVLTDDGVGTYLECVRNCPTTVTVTPPPAPPVVIQQQQGCSDCISVDQALRLVAEQRLMAETILRYQSQQQGGNNSSGSKMSQEEFYLSNRQLDLMEEAAKTQKRQGRWGITLNTMLGAAGVGMQAWHNVLVGQGRYQSNLINNTYLTQGGTGNYIPTDGDQVGSGTGTGTGTGQVYTPSNWEGNNGVIHTTNTGTGNNSGSNGGGYTYYPKDDGQVGGGRYASNSNFRSTNATDLLNGR